MEKKLRELFLSELRIVPFKAGEKEVTDELLVEAMTLNENLKTLGYTLSAKGIIQIAHSDSLRHLYNQVKECIGTVPAKPMYPNFPQQVMNMDEATFRFHQIVHYFSTYGMEKLLGVSVKKGWLPDVEDTEKTEKDTTLLKAKVVELVDQNAACFISTQRILSKRERITDKERDILRMALPCISGEEMSTLQIPFKQNMMLVFYTIFISDMENKVELLKNLCKHTGDVLKCMDYALTRCKYHFRTSEKRLLVHLLESYPVEDFKANLILSSKKAKRYELLISYASFNTYSRSWEHMAAVASLRSGDLRSWESRAKYLLSTGDDGALDFIAERPGMMLRMVAWLLRLGYNKHKITERLTKNAASLNTQTIVSVMNFFGKESCEKEDKETIFDIFFAVLRAKLSQIKTPLAGKKVYFDLGEYDLENSLLLCNEKSDEGGYIVSGLAYKIPEDVKRVRFFVYWNDKKRVDIDLHAYAIDLHSVKTHIGWNGGFNESQIVHSGDITHSNAAEYIDIDLSAPLQYVNTEIHLYDGKPDLKSVDTCFVGMMAVNKIGEDVRLYDPANCFFSHNLTMPVRTLHYGFVDVEHRCLKFLGKESGSRYGDLLPMENYRFNLASYMSLLVETQQITVVDKKEEAEATVVMAKPFDKEISLIDNNFFLDL